VRVVRDTQLVGDRQQDRIGFRNRFVLFQLFHQLVRFSRVGTAEDRPGLLVEKTDLVPLLAPAPEVSALPLECCRPRESFDIPAVS
jgi:hypothetical protein